MAEARRTEGRVHQLRSHALRLIGDRSLPELATWKGAAGLVSLWLVLTMGCALTPFYVLLRIPFLRGGYRFALIFLPMVAIVALIVFALVFTVAMAGFGAGR